MALPFDHSTLDAIVTDPPYYDNVPYADISDFFYVWLKRTIGHIYPEHFVTDLTPKKKEAIAEPVRHNRSRTEANQAYEEMMASAFGQANRVLKSMGSLVIVYAHKTTLGWATLVEALRQAGFAVVEAWPLDTEMKARLRGMNSAALASSIFLVAQKRNEKKTGSYEGSVQGELHSIVRERVDTLWEMGISGADLVISAVGAGLRAFTRYERVEYANGEEVPAEQFLKEVEGVVLDTILEKIFCARGYSVSAVDGPSRFYVLWRYAYKATELDAGEAIVFSYSQPVELDGQNSVSTGKRALVEKKKGKYRLKDFTERGEDDGLGLPGGTGFPAGEAQPGRPVPLIDTLHRILWLVEYQPHGLKLFLDEAKPDQERLRLLAQAIAGTALQRTRRTDENGDDVIHTTPKEHAALTKLLANWKSLIENQLAASEGKLF